MSSLALSMIVKDAARFLPQCLESVSGIVQEIVVADSGSSDSTIAIAEAFGARILRIPWRDDFSAARNSSLQEVRSEWILSLDADEMLHPEARYCIPPLLANSSVYGYQVTIRNFVLSLQDRIWDKPAQPNDSTLPCAKTFPAHVDHQNVRLFRNDPTIRFVGRVHESVGPSLLQRKRAIPSANFLIFHFGLALAAEERAAKNRFYRELGRQKLLDMPEDAQAHLELGIVELDNFADLDEALRLFVRACTLNPRLATAWFFQAHTLVRKERFGEAVQCLRRAESLGLRTALAAETQGDAHYNSGSFPDAAASYQVALRREPDDPSLLSKLGLALVRSADHVTGLRHLKTAVARSPDSPGLHDRLMLAYLSLGNVAEAAGALEAKIAAVPHPSASDFLRAASLRCKAGHAQRASQLISLGLQIFPEDKSLLMASLELPNPVHPQPFPADSATF